MQTVTQRLLRYAQVNTQSALGCATTPSTRQQFDLAHMLVQELHELGLAGAYCDSKCYVYASLPATAGCEGLPAIGLIAHMDTSPDASGKNVKPQVVRYTGGDIPLDAQNGVVLSPQAFPALARCVGEQIVCAGGDTLLGADDKAGIAIIMRALEELLAEGGAHGRVCIAFTPDEEVGMGASGFDVAGFGADFAYTVDGGPVSDCEYETFNAAVAEVRLHGVAIHPGSAKDHMVNASLLAMEYHSLLPALETPAHTEGREGFYHLAAMEGHVETATLRYILRDHDRALFAQRKAVMQKAAQELCRRYGAGAATVTITDQYYNMYEVLKDHMEVVRLAEQAMQAAGIARPTHAPVRGGTDGSALSFMGLPCPNLGTGGYNAHGPYEYAVVSEMETGVKIVKNILDPALIRAVFGKKEAALQDGNG